MADHQPGLVAQALNLVSDIANRRHVLSKLIPVGLFLIDAVLCALIIWKVPCKRTTKALPNMLVFLSRGIHR